MLLGHIRLGRLPKTRKWRSVFEVLEVGNADPEAVAISVAVAAERDFADLHTTPGVVGDGLWVISLLGEFSTSADARDALLHLGVEESSFGSPSRLVSALPTRALMGEAAASGAVFDQMADLSLKAALGRHLSGGTLSLFGTSADEVHGKCRELRSSAIYAQVARDFLGEFMSRVVRYAVDREASNFLGSSSEWSTAGDLLALGDRLDTYCRDSSRIVQDFADGWYSKARYHTAEGVTRESSRRFAAHALTKLRMELGGCRDD